MIQPSLEIIKQSSEYKAAVALAGIHNAMSFKPEYFAKKYLFAASNLTAEHHEILCGNYQTNGFR